MDVAVRSVGPSNGVEATLIFVQGTAGDRHERHLAEALFRAIAVRHSFL